MTVQEALAEIVEALRRGDPSGALLRLDAMGAPLEPALDARAAAYRAQALRALARTDEAEQAIHRALRLAKQAGDVDGVAQLRPLQASILASVAARRTAELEAAKDAHLCDASEDALFEGAMSTTERAARLIRRSEARMHAGRTEEARADLVAARDLASGVLPTAAREAVFARLGLARIDPSDAAAHLHAAHAVADESDDMNLITAVAQAARASGVKLIRPGFG
jgi:hypothetical protein